MEDFLVKTAQYASNFGSNSKSVSHDLYCAHGGGGDEGLEVFWRHFMFNGVEYLYYLYISPGRSTFSIIMVVEVTDETFDSFVASNKHAVIDCWAVWCGPCRMLSPVIEELSQEREKVAFGKLNVDQNRATPMKYGIMSIPTLLYFKDGQLVDKTIGALSKSALGDRLDKLTV